MRCQSIKYHHPGFIDICFNIFLAETHLINPKVKYTYFMLHFTYIAMQKHACIYK